MKKKKKKNRKIAINKKENELKTTKIKIVCSNSLSITSHIL